jgi:hypothetical protein
VHDNEQCKTRQCYEDTDFCPVRFERGKKVNIVIMGTKMCSAKQDNVKKTQSSTRQYLEQRKTVSVVVLSIIIYNARQDKMMLW